MKLHEYQAKDLLRPFGVSTLMSQVAFNLDEAMEAVKTIGFPCVIKAQVHSGGRGKAGGIKIAKNLSEAREHAQNILNMTIKTPQTTAIGQKVSAILIEEAAEILHESYISILIDREKKAICLLASKDGGMEIEELSLKDPHKIKKVWVKKNLGLMPFQARDLVIDLGIEKEWRAKWVNVIEGLFNAFVACDASLLEINPLALIKEGDLIALDAKMIVDDNALYRHQNISLMRDRTEEDVKEMQAFDNNLSYVALDGSIGCMVNGAGLAMATMDMIKYVGGEPANFLDVGGSATEERVEEALKIMVSDPKVKAIFINVFGGIVKCDLIAEGLVMAAKSLKLTLPLVVRLEGTNVEIGRQILSDSNLKIYPAASMLEGAKKAVSLAI